VIDPTSAPQYFGGSTAASSPTTSKAALDKDAFMKLLVAQLRHQDPLSPLQPDQMAAQLAQFTSVEQLTQLNTAVNTQTQVAQMAALSAQSSLSASLLGREVEAVGNQVSVPSNGQAQILVDIGGGGGKGTLTFSDASGKVIATRDLGTLNPGASQTIRLPADLPPGVWHYSLDVAGAKGVKAPVTTYSSGLVSAVEFRSGEIMLQANGLEIALSNLVRIQPASTTTGGTTTTTTVPTPNRREGGPLGLPGLPDGFTGN
jgi:flagellar basal-body rod modification protein FlgD